MSTRRYAIVNGEKVVNVILWDGQGDYAVGPDKTLELAPDRVDAHWRRVAGQWVPPDEPVDDALGSAAERQQQLEAATAKLVGLGLTPEEAAAVVGVRLT